MTANIVRSADGTTIAYDKHGDGPASIGRGDPQTLKDRARAL
jgi:hypothetical protein